MNNVVKLQKYFDRYPYVSFQNESFHNEKEVCNYLVKYIFQELLLVWSFLDNYITGTKCFEAV